MGLVLLAVTPGATEAVEEVASAVAGVDLCDDVCDDGDGNCCPTSCTHCACCAHPSTVPASRAPVPGEPIVEQRRFASRSESPHARGYRAPPFRPPAV